MHGHNIHNHIPDHSILTTIKIRLHRKTEHQARRLITKSYKMLIKSFTVLSSNSLASLQKSISCADTSASMCIWSKRLIFVVPINTFNQLCRGCLSWLNLNRDTFFSLFIFPPSQTDELAWKASAWQVQVKDGQTIAWESGSCWFYIIN